MADEIEIEVIIDPKLDSSDIEKTSKKAGQKSGKGFTDGFDSRAGRGFKKSLGSIKGQLIAVAAAFSAAFAIRGAVNAVKSVEKIETQLKILTGSAEGASAVLKDLQDFAANTPFRLEGIARAANQLISFGFSAGDITDRLQKLGDVAAGSNSDIQEIALIFGQVSAAGKLTGERLLQLQERAIPIGPALAKSLGVATSEVRKLITEGKVGFPEFEKAFNSLSASGGLFEGALEAQSRTLGGVLSTLGDNFFTLQNAIGGTFAPAIIQSARSLIPLIQQFSKDIAQNGPALVKTFNSLSSFFLIEPSKFIAGLFSGSGTQSLRDTTAEITKLEKELALTEKRIASTKGSRFAEIFGGRKAALQQFGEIASRLSELKTLRQELIDVQGSNTDAVKKELETAAEQKKKDNEEASRLSNQIKLRKELGNVGLTQLEQLQTRQQQEQELLRNALEQRAITEEEFQARSLQSAAAFQEASAKIVQTGSNTTQNAVTQLNETISSQLRNGAVNLVSRSMQLIGRSLVTGGKFFDNLVATILDALGTIAISIGTTVIGASKAIIALQASLSGLPGGVAIAAGLALIAVGGALKAISSSLGGGGGGSIPAADASPLGSGGGGFGGESDLTAQVQEREAPSTQVGVTIQGDVLDSDETGLRIVDILNSAFDKEGVVIKSGAVG